MRRLCLAFACTLLAAQPAVPYRPDWASLDTRPVPAWFQDAKLGIFIHWGVYSVPAYTKKGGYAEWYYKGWKEGKPESAVVQFHARTYGKATYEDLAPRFTAELWDPKGWAGLFARSGARYVVLTSKHHDGYCLWPSPHRPGWNAMDVGPKRDLVGELTEAVRGAGLKMGLYYSLPEWTHPRYRWTFPQEGQDVKAYVAEHMLPQVKDLVTRYKPSVFWADGEWDHPDSVWRSQELVAWLYNQPHAQDLVVNDRWGSNTRFRHGGFDATEYTEGKDTGTRPWEECRGLGRSFGLNRNEALEDYQSAEQLIHMFARIVSRGGNLLLNIGPAADGTIPVIMQERLLELGAWLKTNGASVYGSRTWTHADEGKDLLYTQGSDGAVYVTALRWPGDALRLPRFKAAPGSTVRLLGSGAPLPWTHTVAEGTTVQLPCAPPDPKAHAFVFRLEGVSNVTAPVSLAVGGRPASGRTLILGPTEVHATSTTPGAQFAYTLDGTEPGAGSPRTSGALRLDGGAKLRVRALRDDLQASPVTALDVERTTPAPAAKGLRTLPGLDVLQAMGSWDKLPDFAPLPGATRTTAPNPSIALLPRPEQAGLRFTGYLKAPRTGVYTFHLASDDGSRLSLDGRVLLDHDGLHNDAQVRSAPVALEAGLHPFLLDYFQGGGGATLRLEIEGPDLPRQPLPAALGAADALPLPAIPFAPKHYVCQRAATPPKVDGRLDDAVWQQAAWTEDFQDIEGFLKPKPRFRTRAKLLWDDTHLYIAAEMEEPDVWGTLTQKDCVIFHDNDFEVFLDPEGSTWPYYEFEMNALNTMWDLMLRHPYRDAERVAVNGWDCAGLRSAVAVQGTLNDPRDRDQGWTVELAIPLASLTELATRGRVLPPGADGAGRGLPRAGDAWRLNFSRVQWHTEVKDGKTVKVKKADGNPLPEDNWVWSPTGLVAIHYPEMWGFLHFSGRPAGSEEPRPELSPADHATWGLRRIYYAQRTFHAKHSRYGANLKELELTKVLPQGWSLWMEAGERQWMAEARQGRTTITIDTRGAVETRR